MNVQSEKMKIIGLFKKCGLMEDQWGYSILNGCAIEISPSRNNRVITVTATRHGLIKIGIYSENSPFTIEDAEDFFLKTYESQIGEDDAG